MSSDKRFSSVFKIFKDSFIELQKHDPLLLSSSVAFFTLFALPPILIIVINILGGIFKEEIISGKVYKTLVEVFGQNSGQLIQKIISNFENLGNTLLFTILGSFFLIFVGTTTFSVIQKALNQIWQVKTQFKIMRIFRDRFISLAIILGSGLLFFLFSFSDTMVTLMTNYLKETLSNTTLVTLVIAVNQLFSMVAVIIWFAFIFKYLPDIKISWKPVSIGAIVTGIFFTIGKYLLGLLLINSNISTIYGAAGSIVLLLLFLFYSSLIIFYGAAFTKIYATSRHYEITAKHYAVIYEINELKENHINL